MLEVNQINGTNINIQWCAGCVGHISSSAMHVQCMNVAQNASHSVLMYNYTESLFHVIRASVKWVESSGSYCQ